MTNRQKQDIDEQRLDAWLGSMPVLPPSPGFVDGVMRAVRNPKRSWHQRAWDFCFAPRVVRFNFAGATMAAVVAFASAWMLWNASPQSAQLAGRGAATMTQGTVTQATVKVRFTLDQQDARRVALVGDFTQWQTQIPLKRAPDGAWIAEIALPAGDYEYMFVVDQTQWVSDPRAQRYRADGFGNRNAVVTVPSV